MSTTAVVVVGGTGGGGGGKGSWLLFECGVVSVTAICRVSLDFIISFSLCLCLCFFAFFVFFAFFDLNGIVMLSLDVLCGRVNT